MSYASQHTVQVLESRRLLSAFAPEFGDPSQVAIGDLDRDGLPDFATIQPAKGPTAGGTAVLRLYHNNGDGTQTVRKQLLVEVPGRLIGGAITTGDLDGDGAPDLAYKLFSVTGQPTPVGEARNERIGVLINTGKGDLVPSGGAAADIASISKGTKKEEVEYSGIAIGDLDGDGRADIANWTKTSFAVLLGDGKGNAKLSTVKSNPLYQDSGMSGTNPLFEGRIEGVTDLDGDGAAEVIGTDGRSVLIGKLTKADAGFAVKSLATPGRAPIQRVLTGDVDGDALPDLVVVAGQQVIVGLNQPKRDIGPIKWMPPEALRGNARTLLIGDLDGDGKAEVSNVLKTKHDMAKSIIQNIRA